MKTIKDLMKTEEENFPTDQRFLQDTDTPPGGEMPDFKWPTKIPAN